MRPQVEAAGEHRATLQQSPFRFVEQIVGPLHHVAQRLVPFQPASGPDQQPETVVEPVAQLRRGHRHHSGRRQFDRQRDTVQPSTDLDYGGRVVTVGDRKVSRETLCAFDEQQRRRRFDVAIPESSEGTVQSCSSLSARPSRLVARIVTVAECWKMFSISSAAASRTCSQLSKIRSRCRLSKAMAMLSVRLIPGCWMIPSTPATASGTAAGSPTAASSTRNAPSRKSIAERVATSSASRVLPTPPTPVRVTRRWALSVVCTSTMSDSRPTIDVVGERRFPGVGSAVRRGGKSVRSPNARTCWMATGLAISRSRRAPRSTRSTR